MAIPLLYLFMLSLVFRGYVTGTAVPPWDFMGGGHVESYRWYKDGGFFDPPSWFPYAWFGLPEHQLVQNGGWVIPIAVVAETLGWTPRMAALVQFFYIWLGGVGAFVLARVLNFGTPISFLVGFIYLFSIMNFSNAQHSSMLRAATLLPLVIVAFLPKWLLKSPYLVIVTAALLWQVVVSSYPGNLVVIALVLAGIIIGSVLFTSLVSRRRYLVRALVALAGGVLLAAPRWLPVFLDRSSFPVMRENTAALSWQLLPTLVSSFDLPGLPNDVTMRSIWLAPICLAALFFIRKTNHIGLLAILYGSVSLLAMTELLGVSQLKDLIPGLRLSTFAISDWRPILILSGALLLGSVLRDGLVNGPFLKGQILRRLGLFVTILALIAGLEFVRNQSLSGSGSLYLLAVIAGLIFGFTFFVKRSDAPQVLIVASLGLVTFASVLLISSTVSRTWQADRALSEAYVYGAGFSELGERVVWPLKSRPARWYIEFPPLDYAEATGDVRFNRFWVTGEPSAAGAHNVKFSSTYQKITESFTAPEAPLINFLSTQSRQLVEPLAKTSISAGDINACAARSRDCNPSELPVEIEHLTFDKQSEEFLINAQSAFRLIQNEPAHRGWQSKICFKQTEDLVCEPGPGSVIVNESLRGWDLPKGRYTLQTRFVTPGEGFRWWLFGLGGLLSLGYPLLVSFQRLSQHSNRV